MGVVVALDLHQTSSDCAHMTRAEVEALNASGVHSATKRKFKVYST